MPLYSSITGLDINIKLQITPKYAIPRALSSEVLGELRSLINTSLSTFVALKSRIRTVFYGPKKSKNGNKYYVFDIILFNSSNTIYFKSSLNEIRAFYGNLKTKNIIYVSGYKIPIEINFSHTLVRKLKYYYDLSRYDDGSFRVIDSKTMEDVKERPSRTLSNLNWCNRVPVNVDNETERIGEDAYAIKPLGIAVFHDEFDRLYGTFPYILLLCEDLFKTQDDNSLSDQTEDDFTIPVSNTTYNIMALPVPVNVAIISASFGLCFVFIIYRIRYTSTKPVDQSEIHVGPDSMGPPTGIGEIGSGSRDIIMVDQEHIMGDTNNDDDDICKPDMNLKSTLEKTNKP